MKRFALIILSMLIGMWLYSLTSTQQIQQDQSIPQEQQPQSTQPEPQSDAKEALKIYKEHLAPLTLEAADYFVYMYQFASTEPTSAISYSDGLRNYSRQLAEVKAKYDEALRAVPEQYVMPEVRMISDLLFSMSVDLGYMGDEYRDGNATAFIETKAVLIKKIAVFRQLMTELNIDLDAMKKKEFKYPNPWPKGTDPVIEQPKIEIPETEALSTKINEESDLI